MFINPPQQIGSDPGIQCPVLASKNIELIHHCWLGPVPHGTVLSGKAIDPPVEGWVGETVGELGPVSQGTWLDGSGKGVG